MSRSALFLVTVFATTTTQDSSMHGSSNANFSMVHKHEDLVVASVAVDGSIHMSNSVDSGSPGSGSMAQYMTDSMDASTIGKMDTMVKKSTAGSTGAILDSNIMDSADSTDTNQMETVSVVEIADKVDNGGAALSPFAKGDKVVLEVDDARFKNAPGEVVYPKDDPKMQKNPGRVGVKVEGKMKAVLPEKLKADDGCSRKFAANRWVTDCGGGTHHGGDHRGSAASPTKLKRSRTAPAGMQTTSAAGATGAAAGPTGGKPVPKFIDPEVGCKEKVNYEAATSGQCWSGEHGAWKCSCLKEHPPKGSKDPLRAYKDCGGEGSSCKTDCELAGSCKQQPKFIDSWVVCKQKVNYEAAKSGQCWNQREYELAGVGWSCSCLKEHPPKGPKYTPLQAYDDCGNKGQSCK